MRKIVSGTSVSEFRRLLALSGLVCGLLVLSVGCGDSKSEETEANAEAAVTEEQAADLSVADAPGQAAEAEADKPAVTAKKTQAETQPGKKSEPKAPATRAVKPKTVKPRTIEIPSGMNLVIELQETIETGQSQTGDHFRATLVEALVVSGETVFKAGAPVTGRIDKAVASGRLKTDAELVVSILEIDGVPISSDVIEDKASSHADRNKKLIGGGAIVGGILGALKSKNVKGAIVGAAAGAAVGTGAAVLTGKKNLKYESGTILQFTLADPVAVEMEN